MGTRSVVEFRHPNSKTGSRIYCHWDGGTRGDDLKEFINTVSQLDDRRFDDPEYLASKYVCWVAYSGMDRMEERKSKADFLNFLGVGICSARAVTLAELAASYGCEYYYVVECRSWDKPHIHGWDMGGEMTFIEEWSVSVDEEDAED